MIYLLVSSSSIARGTGTAGRGAQAAAQLSMAYLRVHSFAFRIASLSFTFHSSATSLARGSSGLGADSSAWIDRSTVRIWSAGLHLSFNMSKHIRPSRSMLGWYIFVINLTLGADMGQSSGRNNSNLNSPPSKGESSGPVTITWKQRALFSLGTALIPGTGSCINRCVSLIILRGRAAILNMRSSAICQMRATNHIIV